MSDDITVKNKVKTILERKGFVVNEIPESQNRTPDLLIQKNGINLLLEIKSKSHSLTSDRETSIEMGTTLASRVERNGIYENIIQSAYDQLTQPTNPVAQHCLIWLEIESNDFIFHQLQFYHSLFGLKTGVGIPNGEPKPVFFCDHSDFFKFKQKLAGIVVSSESFIYGICNPYYSEMDSFLKSTIFDGWEVFGDKLHKLESAGEIYIADFDINRNDEVAISTALANKYHFEAMFCTPLSRLGVSFQIR